jgi:restriction endonuclease S subunit
LVFHFEISKTWSFQIKKIILTAFVACTVSLAFAESGTYEGISSGTTSVTTNDFGNNKYSISNTSYTGRILKSTVSYFKVGSISVVQCLGVATVENSKSVSNGTCLSTDSDGDKSRVNFVRNEITPQGFNGTLEIVGLTGKYENVKGTCTYVAVRQVLNSTIHLSNQTKCSVSK